MPASRGRPSDTRAGPGSDEIRNPEAEGGIWLGGAMQPQEKKQSRMTAARCSKITSPEISHLRTSRVHFLAERHR